MFFTKYAEEKFEILNKHKIYFTREQIKDVVLSPEKIDKKEKHVFASRNNICVVYKENNNQKKIVTFYPI